MLRRKSLVAGALAPMVLGMSARWGFAESLRDAWACALTANPSLQAARVGVAAAQDDLAAARRERVPTVRTVNAQTFLSTQPTFKNTFNLNGLLGGSALPGAPAGAGAGAGLGLPAAGTLLVPFSNQNFFFSSTLMNVPIYTGGRIASGIDRASAAVGTAAATECTSAQELKLQVARAYLTVLRLEKLLRLARSNVASLESHARDVQNLLDQGVVNRNDLLSAQVSLARGRQRVIQVRNELDAARSAYNRLLNRPLTFPARLEEVPFAPLAAGAAPAGDPSALPADGPARSPGEEAEIARLTDLAVRIRPELAGLAHQARALQADAEIVDSLKRPQVGVIGGYTYIQDSYLRDPNFWSGTIAGEWLLFDGHKTRFRTDALRLRQEQTMRLRQDAASQVALAIRQAWEKGQSDRASLEVARAAIVQAEENLRVARDRYRQQTGTNTEVIDAETLRLQTYTDYYNAHYDVLYDDFQLRRAVGIL